ncbi:MAG: ATP-binding protein [Gemmatimonadota bacterium]|nr:ATP-binding protein [Gemmatimonadota bacterium]MDH5804281.1 ATP-binding protein [Gemmatimonadota bacterium]
MDGAPLRLYVRRPLRQERAHGIRLTVEVPSEIEFVETAVDLVVRQSHHTPVPEKLIEFNLRVALTEALVNAIQYGNNADPEKCVTVCVRESEDEVEVTVTDQGNGFDPACIPDPRTSECLKRPEGRGLFLIQQLVHDLTFNERGNSLCMKLRRA